MSANRSYCDPAGLSRDWIELFNGGGSAIDISGFRLSDRADAVGHVFPEGTRIEPGEYLVVWCDGGAAEPGVAPFSLSAGGGESLRLSTGAGQVVDQLVTPALAADLSYARDESGAWRQCDRPSPGYENSEAGHAAYLAAVALSGDSLVVTEFMASNQSCLQDAFGEFSDWIELFNAGADSLRLQGYYLSDNPDNPDKWALPDITLEGGERLVVFASGRDTLAGTEPHANFSLNRHQGTIILRAPNGQIVGSHSYSSLGANESCYRDESTGEWRVGRQATPGYENSEAGYERFMAAALPAPGLVISEVMPGNGSLLEQANGLFYDWIELENRSDQSLSLSGYALTDNLAKAGSVALPDVALEPGERFMLMCTDMELSRCDYMQVSLSLSAAEDSLYLLDGEGRVADYLFLCDVPYGGSCGRMPAEGGLFYFASPTPAETNRDGRRLLSAAPVPSLEQGLYESPSLELALSAPGTIYYTLDGSDPDADATPYAGPLTLEGAAVIRAVALEEGKLMSECVTLSYFLGTEHSLPIVSVVTDPDNLYDSKLGIFAGVNLFDRTVERPASIAYFNGAERFATDCGLKLHGAGSRGRLEKKSFKITFRARYGGAAPLEFPLFEDNDTTTYYSILLRNSQDYRRGYIRDELITWIAYRSTEELLVQDTRYCVL
ncbi:MAG: lamin tail domain-containing protein, partial [Clostridia bacterium]|nr:lamin tail domain-containing protein [Clostridia bacterium]